MLTIVAVVVACAVAVVLILAASKPDSFRVQRSAVLQAPPEAVFEYLDDFRKWGDWSPYEKVDPAMKRTFSGPGRGKGSVYEWDGNKKIGKGRMEIIEVSEPRKVALKLDFLKPFEAHNTAEFTLSPRGDSTEVTWAMSGPLTFFGRLMHVFINMDKMVGKSFEEGLANLKSVAER